MEVTIFDIDGTLADISHRLDFVNGAKKDYKKFYDGIPDDKPIEPLVELAKLLILSGVEVLFTSGRPEATRNITINWLKNNGIITDFNTRLFMRKDGDYRPDDKIKEEILHQIQSLGFAPKLVFEDRQKVVDMWRSHGIRVAQVAPGNF